MRFLLASVLLVSCVADSPTISVSESALAYDPSAPGLYAVGSMRYDVGHAVYANPPTADLIVPIRAEVRYPAVSINGEGVGIAPGVFPVVVFGHGRTLPADSHYALMAHLASHGYIGVAIDLAALDGARSNLVIEYKAQHFIHNVNVLMKKAPGVLRGHVDKGQISLGGHSQGGDAALRAAYNAQVNGTSFQARTVIGVAPQDSSGNSYFMLTPNAVAAPYFGFQGSIDGDVGMAAGFPFGADDYNGLAFRAYDRATGSKAFAYVEDICHNLLSETYPSCEGWTANPLSQAVHQQVLRGYLTTFLAWQIGGDATARPVLEAGLPGMPVVAHHQIHDADALVIDDFSDGKTNLVSSGGSYDDIGFAEIAEDALWRFDLSSPHGASGALLRWTAPGAIRHVLFEREIDASGYRSISMRLGQAVGLLDVNVAYAADQTALDSGQLGSTMTSWINAHGGIHPQLQVIVETAGARWRIENGSQRLLVIRDPAAAYGGGFWFSVRNANIAEQRTAMPVRIRLTDADGNSEAHDATVDAPVVPPQVASSSVTFDIERRTLAALQTIQIELRRFRNIDLTRVTQLALELDAPRGELLVDDIEFAP